MKILNALLLFGAMQLPMANAATLYVAEEGYGSECSKSMPCNSIQMAVDIAAAYDHVVIGKGKFFENVTIPMEKTGLELTGKGRHKTEIIAADLAPVKEAPAGVPAEIIIDIFAPDVTIKNLSVIHPAAMVSKRDIGIFVRPPAVNVKLDKLRVKRMRSGDVLEPFMPSSRGVLVFRATGATIVNSKFQGNYEDHIHLPTSAAIVKGNEIEGATRLGIVVIQESPDSFSVDNVIINNEVEESGSDGIQIQGDNNIVKNNEVEENGGFGIHLCGPSSTPACVAPGNMASADNNTVKHNKAEENALGDIADNGVDNLID